MALPTWHGQPVDPDDVQGVTREAFEHVRKTLQGLSDDPVTEAELLHLIEAVSHLENEIKRLRSTTILDARAAGATLAKLGTAMGIPRATAQYHYERATQVSAEMWVQSHGTIGVDPS